MLSPELDAVIVENIGDLDETAHRIEVLQELLFRELGDIVEDWADRAGWLSDNDWFGKEGINVLPPEWKIDPDDGAFAYFTLDYGARDTGKRAEGEDYHELTRLVGAGKGKLGFRLVRNPGTKAGRRLGWRLYRLPRSR